MSRPTTCKLNAKQKLWRVLDVLETRGKSPTYVIRNWIHSREMEPDAVWPGVKTSQILAVCKKAEKLGLVEQSKTSYAVMKVWRIKNEGRLIALRGEA